MFNSPFFDNSSHGVGGWGDPNNDCQIYTGGFKDAIRAYPNPHHIRRNFTFRPFQNSLLTATPAMADLMINTTMTKENVDNVLTNFDGDFIGFHTYSESFTVSFTFHCLLFGRFDPSV